MGDCYNTKFRIRVDRQSKGWWSFGAAISHMQKETYLYINLFKWSISIGFLYDYEDEYFIDNF